MSKKRCSDVPQTPACICPECSPTLDRHERLMEKMPVLHVFKARIPEASRDKYTFFYGNIDEWRKH